MDYLLVNCTFMALEMRLLGCFIVAEVTLEPHIFLGSIQPLHPNYYRFKTFYQPNRGEYISKNFYFCTTPKNGPAQESSYAW